MKKAVQQLALAIVFGLGIPGLIFGVTANADDRISGQTTPNQETSAWTAPAENEGGLQ